MAALTLRSWEDFTVPNKYGPPSDVNAIFERVRLNVPHYLANYLALGGAILAIGVFLNFGVFFTMALALGIGFGGWFAAMKYLPQFKANSLPILGVVLCVTFYIGLKLVGEEYSMTVWWYLILSLLPGLLHSLLKKRNPVVSAVNKASNAVKDVKREF